MKTDAQLAQELLEVIEQRKSLDKRESDLKDLFKTKLNSQGINTLSVGGILISLVSKERSNLDKKALVAAFGEETVQGFERIAKYIQVDVKSEQIIKSKKAA
jgi:hypothetical protein